MKESENQARVLLQIGSRSDCRCWRNNTGKARSFDGERVISFGLKGSTDVLGVVRIGPVGLLLAIETKSPTGRLSPEQESFQKMVIAFGGCHIVARTPEEALDQLETFIARTRKTLGIQ